ncbi:High affinity Ca2+/Mn2+ P-type ATPase-like protein, partial [Coemansia nantahalensis]
MPVPAVAIEYPAPKAGAVPRGPLLSTSEYAAQDAQAVLGALCVDAGAGLTALGARQRREAYGANTLEAAEDESLAAKFVKSIATNSMVLLLLGSAAVSVAVGNWDDAFSITLAVLIVSAVGFVQEYRSEQSLAALSSLVPNHCHVVREGGQQLKMLADDLVPGDIVRLATGDRV